MKIKALFISAILYICTVSALFAGTTATSGVSCQTIIDRARVDLNEATASFWADSDLIQWTDEAVKEIVSKTGCLEETAFTISLSADTWDYAITPDYLDVVTVLHDSGDTTSATRLFSLERTDIKSFGHSKERGRPKSYSVWDDEIVIFPIPDSTQSGTTLYVYAVSLPSGVTEAASVIETPAYFDPAIVSYVKAKAYQKDKRESLSGYYLSLFNTMLRDYVANVLGRSPAAPAQ